MLYNSVQLEFENILRLVECGSGDDRKRAARSRNRKPYLLVRVRRRFYWSGRKRRGVPLRILGHEAVLERKSFRAGKIHHVSTFAPGLERRLNAATLSSGTHRHRIIP